MKVVALCIFNSAPLRSQWRSSVVCVFFLPSRVLCVQTLTVCAQSPDQEAGTGHVHQQTYRVAQILLKPVTI